MKCLMLAATKHKSIAFPAIGTGGLQLRRDEVARIMSEAVVNFALNISQTLGINFVIYPSDTETFKVGLQKLFRI